MKTIQLFDGPLTAKCELDTTVEVPTARNNFVNTDHPITRWIFYIGDNPVSWDDLGIEDRLTVAREFAQRWYWVEGDVIPWGDDIGTLVALEGM